MTEKITKITLDDGTELPYRDMPWCGDAHCPFHHYVHALCDDDGVVRSGAMHHGTDYPCTGHAHFAGYHIRCTSPAHHIRPAIQP
ncbi:MAG: hypothetical protein LC798_07080 [Chloroflexi bacterium]|nr:hypothetical protein [Chloroflexota bacterium]